LISMKPHDAGQFCSVGGSDWSRSDKCRQARFECEWLSSRAHLEPLSRGAACYSAVLASNRAFSATLHGPNHIHAPCRCGLAADRGILTAIASNRPELSG
jgi:hypothetical protein